MRGYAIVGPDLEGRGAARDTHGIGFYLRCGHDIPAKILPPLLRVPEAAPELGKLFVASAAVRAAAEKRKADSRLASGAVA